MKKLILMLCLALALCFVCGCGDNEAKDTAASNTQPPVSSTAPSATPEPNRAGNPYPFQKPRSDRDYALAASASLDPPYQEEYTKAGFTRDDVMYRKVDLPFAIFVFDRQGQLIEDATTVCCPVITNGEYVGRVGITYSEKEKQNLFEYHKDTLLIPIPGGTVDTRKILTLGKTGSKTFVTDGVNLDILAVDDTPHPDDLSDSELKAMAETFKTAVVKATKNWYTELEHYRGLMFNMQPIEQ